MFIAMDRALQFIVALMVLLATMFMGVSYPYVDSPQAAFLNAFEYSLEQNMPSELEEMVTALFSDVFGVDITSTTILADLTEEELAYWREMLGADALDAIQEMEALQGQLLENLENESLVGMALVLQDFIIDFMHIQFGMADMYVEDFELLQVPADILLEMVRSVPELGLFVELLGEQAILDFFNSKYIQLFYTMYVTDYEQENAQMLLAEELAYSMMDFDFDLSEEVDYFFGYGMWSQLLGLEINERAALLGELAGEFFADWVYQNIDLIFEELAVAFEFEHVDLVFIGYAIELSDLEVDERFTFDIQSYDLVELFFIGQIQEDFINIFISNNGDSVVLIISEYFSEELLPGASFTIQLTAEQALAFEMVFIDLDEIGMDIHFAYRVTATPL